MSLQTISAHFVRNVAGALITGICACLCDNTVLSPCNGSDRVKKSLTLTFNWHGITHNFPLTWIVESSFCFNQEGWEYDGGDIVICSGSSPTFTIRQWALCCDVVSFKLTIAYLADGVLQTLQTDSGIDPFTVVATAPMHLTTTIPGLDFCGLGSDDALVDIQ